MNLKLLISAFFGFIGATFSCRLMEGTWFTAADSATVNNLTVFKTVSIFNLFSIPTFNLNFFTKGIPALMTLDYPFFGGKGELLQYAMYAFSFAIALMFLSMFVGVIFNFWSRR